MGQRKSGFWVIRIFTSCNSAEDKGNGQITQRGTREIGLICLKCPAVHRITIMFLSCRIPILVKTIKKPGPLILECFPLQWESMMGRIALVSPHIGQQRKHIRRRMVAIHFSYSTHRNISHPKIHEDGRSPSVAKVSIFAKGVPGTVKKSFLAPAFFCSSLFGPSILNKKTLTRIEKLRHLLFKIADRSLHIQYPSGA